MIYIYERFISTAEFAHKDKMTHILKSQKISQQKYINKLTISEVDFIIQYMTDNNTLDYQSLIDDIAYRYDTSTIHSERNNFLKVFGYLKTWTEKDIQLHNDQVKKPSNFLLPKRWVIEI